MKMNSLISWVGGKKSIRDLIYARFPQSYGRYIEVFGGGGWVLFGKKPMADLLQLQTYLKGCC